MDEVGLGKAIQNARRAAGLTQQELCQQAGLSYSTLAKIERGAIKSPSVFTVERIASVLGASLDSLLGGAGNSRQTAKRKSKSGVSFLYVDINGCMVHFFHAAFSKLAQETGLSADYIESAFWHFNDPVCRGEISMDEFNDRFAQKLGIEAIQWADYYMEAVEPILEMHDLVRWAVQHYRVGLLSNIMPGFIEEMIEKNLLPAVAYDAIIDSSQVRAIKPELEIYEIAQQKAGVLPSEILFVDDSRSNLMGAERLGWRVLWFNDMQPSDSVMKIRAALEF